MASFVMLSATLVVSMMFPTVVLSTHTCPLHPNWEPLMRSASPLSMLITNKILRMFPHCRGTFHVTSHQAATTGNGTAVVTPYVTYPLYFNDDQRDGYYGYPQNNYYGQNQNYYGQNQNYYGQNQNYYGQNQNYYGQNQNYYPQNSYGYPQNYQNNYYGGYPQNNYYGNNNNYNNNAYYGSPQTSVPIPPTTQSGPPASDDWLSEHNRIRGLNGWPSMDTDSSIISVAQYRADQNANGLDGHSGRVQGYGENLAYGYGSCAAATRRAWASECAQYQNGMGFTSQTGHCTQVVWRASTRVGCATSGSACACVYSPAGNVIGQFNANVPRTPIRV